VPEKVEKIGLTTRANRANVIVAEAKKKCMKPMFISVHVNAAGNGGWCNAKGWACYTTKGKTISDAFATKMYEAAHEVLDPLGRKVREDYSDGDPDWEENFTVIYKTNCAAILTENFFMDNKEEAKWLLTDDGINTVVEIHHKGILKYIASL
jgi:N-acetylmuramoyl-L-alanine amidase